MAHQAGGRGVRARPIDIHKGLDIIRDESLLESIEGLPTIPSAGEAPAPEKPKHNQEGTHGAQKEIPIPGVTKVETYWLDYLPTFRERNTYIRSKGGINYEDPTFVEYDLDSEDERWLETFNGNQERLTEEKFEMMIWKLDAGNAAANDRVWAMSGAAPAERLTATACAATENYSKEEALQMLEENCPTRSTIANAVYDYWWTKRRRLGHPLVRQLQAPTPINDQNPYRVFRPREKIHRPQTRRRRENNPDSLEKLHMIRDNLTAALDLFQLVVKRERKKRDMAYVVTDWQQLQIKQRHEPKGSQDTIEQEYLAGSKVKNPKRPIGFEDLPEAAPAATNALLDFKNKKVNKKRKVKLGIEPHLNAVSALPPPPLPPTESIPFVSAPDVSTLESIDPKAIAPAIQPAPKSGNASSRNVRPRFGRGGRLMFDRCHAFTLEPLTPDGGSGQGEEEQGGGVKPMYDLPNPYSQWLNRSDLSMPPPTNPVVKIRLSTQQQQPAAVAAEPAAGKPSTSDAAATGQ